mgnify:CR=1 FL=1
MSKQTFRANVVSVFENEEMGTFGVSFGALEGNETPVHYLLIQEEGVSSFGEQKDEEKSLYVELDSQSNAQWNAVEQIELRRDSVSVFFSSEVGMRNTEPDTEQPLTELVLDFDLSQAEYDAMTAGLTRVTADVCPMLIIEA